MNKTEWLSLRLHSEEIFRLVSRLEVLGGYSEVQLELELQSALTSMTTMISQLRSQILSSPVELRRELPS